MSKTNEAEPGLEQFRPSHEGVEIAEAYVERAEGLWHQPGTGALALAHRLAATLVLALIEQDTRRWRLSPLVRDIVTLGEGAVPASLEALNAQLGDLAGESFCELVGRLAGDIGRAERRFQEVRELAFSVAREISALP